MSLEKSQLPSTPTLSLRSELRFNIPSKIPRLTEPVLQRLRLGMANTRQYRSLVSGISPACETCGLDNTMEHVIFCE